jgi:hypothetical protein
VELPVGATLIYDDMKFSNASGQFGLYIKLTDRASFTLTGSIDPTASTTVTGVSSLFLSEVSVGDEILVSAETRTVSAIASNTSLTVSSATSDNAPDSRRNNKLK